MLAARIYHPKDLRVEEISTPEINHSDHVQVKVSAAGICGSDLHVYQTGAYLSRTPITMGHEFAGQVVAVGEDVREFQIGDHVVGDSRVWCGECRYCARDQFNLCENLGFLGEVLEGAFAEEIVVPARNLLKIGQDVPAPIAALAEPLAVALHAVHQSTLPDAEKILVLGAGPIGALIHAVLQIQGRENVTVADISKFRRRSLQALNGSSKIITEPRGQFDLVFETTGAIPVLQQILPQILQKGGNTILVGLFSKEIPFNFTDIVEKEWAFKGCSCFDTELQDAVELLETDEAAFAHVVSHQLHLSQVRKGFDILLAPEKNAMKIILNPQGNG